MEKVNTGQKVFPIKSQVDIKTENADSAVKVFYNQYITIIKNMLNLTNKQALVLAEIMYQNYLLKDKILDENLRWEAIFSKSNRRVMMDNIEMHSSGFGNNITDLRKKGLLKGIRIPDNLIIYPKDNKFQLVFNFLIDGNGTS